MLKLSNKTNNKIVFFDSQLEAKKWAMNNIKWIRHTRKDERPRLFFFGKRQQREPPSIKRTSKAFLTNETFLLWAFTYQYRPKPRDAFCYENCFSTEMRKKTHQIQPRSTHAMDHLASSPSLARSPWAFHSRNKKIKRS